MTLLPLKCFQLYKQHDGTQMNFNPLPLRLIECDFLFEDIVWSAKVNLEMYVQEGA